MTTAINKKTQLETQPLFFTSDWWNDFVEQTDNFTSHKVIKNGISADELTELRALVNSILQKVSADPLRLGHTRVWADGSKENNPAKFFKENPITEDIEAWGNRVFKDKKYGMFINYANTHSEELTQKLHQYVQPYLDNFGIPMKGISTTIILGNYGWTPLGIHNDHKGEYILHFHLGPGEKDMYIWDREKADKLGYQEKVKVENFEEFMEQYDHKATFNTGDLFSMPGKCVHIGNTKEFSIGLVIEFNGLTKQEFAKKLWFDLRKQLFDSVFHGKEATILPPYKPEEHEKFIENLMRQVKHYNIDLRESLEASLHKIYKEHKYALLSNAGLSLHGFTDHQSILSNDSIADSYLALEKPFSILYYEEDNKHHLFVRGKKISCSYHQDIPKLIERINKGNAMKISEIETKYFKDWSNKEALYQLIGMLYKYRGINLTLNS